ncbi:hypothetical protein LJC20_03710 [Eubacteriales bacterium OttesenSCG-928-M02]|nr:hypothetical protein [Eubacteriales bacterium OttesenSCG-928-M02]
MKVNTTKNIGEKPMTDEEMDALADGFGKKLAKEEKVQVRIPLLPGEGTTVECSINGHNFVIKRGQSVMLPKSVVELLSNAGIV